MTTAIPLHHHIGRLKLTFPFPNKTLFGTWMFSSLHTVVGKLR